jgi:hypothetical protein
MMKDKIRQNKKAARLRPLFSKEAWRKGKSLREGDARCSLDSRRDTQIEEVSKLGRGLKSLNFTASFVCLYLSNSQTKVREDGCRKTASDI